MTDLTILISFPHLNFYELAVIIVCLCFMVTDSMTMVTCNSLQTHYTILISLLP